MAPKAKAKAKAKGRARAKAKGQAAPRGQGAAAGLRRNLLARPAMHRPAAAGANGPASVRIRVPPGSTAATAGGGSGNQSSGGNQPGTSSGGGQAGASNGGVAGILATALQGGAPTNQGVAATSGGGNQQGAAAASGGGSQGPFPAPLGGAGALAGGGAGASVGAPPGSQGAVATGDAPQSPLLGPEDEKDKRIRELEAQLWAAQATTQQQAVIDVQAILAARAGSVAEAYQAKRLKTAGGTWWQKDEEQQGLQVKSGESLLQVSQRAPGQLLLAGCKRMIGSMTGAAALGMTAPLDEDTLRPHISTYLTTVLLPGAKNKEALKNKRNHSELEALAAILDAALSGEVARCADVAMQRFKALEWVLDGSSWELAEEVELKNTQKGLTTDQEKEAAMRALAAKQRLQKASGAGSSWGGYP
mmetsp:Transcript_4393/g.9500  ORF Transcript_4393/g.9500 Transcript_4393/m.9500 type:complete len:418 (-) Transcript_4393:1114-2367(-)